MIIKDPGYQCHFPPKQTTSSIKVIIGKFALDGPLLLNHFGRNTWHLK